MEKRHKQTFYQRRLCLENKHMKKMFSMPAIWEMQIKTTMSYRYISIRMARVETVDNSKC